MTKTRYRAGTSILLVLLFASTAFAQNASKEVVSAANAFLATLDQRQRQAVLFAFDDAAQRTRWSNLPVSMVPRAGISFKDMNTAQRAAAWSLLSSMLSRRGFEKIQQIVEGDEVHKMNVNGNPGYGKDLYFISFLGTPSATGLWTLQFGGHHLALNVTVAGDRGVLTPSHTGSQPSLYMKDGKPIRPLGQESDKAIALFNVLDDSQRRQAILKYRVADLVLGPGQDGKTIQPEGLKASAMNEKQRGMLLDLISEWTGIIREPSASARMNEIKAGLNDTWFAWSGPTTAEPGHNTTGYYRIQGPNLVIEYAPQPMGGDASMHIHTIYRDPTNDYGQKLAAK